MKRRIDTWQISAFHQHLKEEERESSTIQKYLREVRGFADWAEEQPVTNPGRCSSPETEKG